MTVSYPTRTTERSVPPPQILSPPFPPPKVLLVGQGSYSVSGQALLFKRDYKMAMGGPTTPDQITGLVGWWKADSLALSDGAAVTSWSDSSGTGNTATQATGGVQPIYKTNILNGKP